MATASKTTGFKVFRDKARALADVMNGVEIIQSALPRLTEEERAMLVKGLKEMIDSFDAKKPVTLFGSGDGSPLPTPSVAVLDFLRRHPDGVKSKDLVRQVVGKFETKGDPQKVVYSTLIYLRRKGIIKKTSEGINILVAKGRREMESAGE